ncbi:insulysin [Entomortierella parvispora]|uniref:Insulysin n=1 Tax=Entomortierella parvispora TaxID=205924 RepID=A0A9P3H9B8_9FUNG|nr:insulysin [Entomortierella parvispora]
MTIEPHALPEGYEESQDGSHFVFGKSIEKPADDKRLYRLIRLKNDMEVLLIHDPESDKAAASMNVHVGSSSDPDNMQGLAHFLEHLLFLGTSKYPRENDYIEYLASHSGSRNAFTSRENTNYYLDVGRDHLEGALDRFAQFFISPLFNQDCQEREARAVDSEYKMNLQNDMWRMFYLEKHLCSRQNPYWKFDIGNLESLQDIPARDGLNVRDEIIKFYRSFYSSNIMKLVILGQEPLDQLSLWAVEKFSEVKNLHVQRSPCPYPPLTQQELQRIVYAKPVKDIKKMTIRIPIPSVSAHYASRPAGIIGHLIGHEGGGSLFSLLKKKGWANTLSSSASEMTLGHDTFTISIGLTNEGLIHHEEVIVLIFQYIKMLQEKGIPSHIYDEVFSLTHMEFRYKDQSRAAVYVQEVGRSMHKGYAPEMVLSGAHLLRDINPKLVMSYIHELQIDRWKAMVVSPDLSIIPGGELTAVEYWYRAEYHVASVSSSLVAKLQTLELHPDLHVPTPNPYIPAILDSNQTEKIPDSLVRPVLIKNTPISRLWHKQDTIFGTPKVNINFRLHSPVAISSPSNHVQSKLMVHLVKDTLEEEAYGATLAGLSYSFTSTMDGMILKISGYSEKANILLERIIHALKTLTPGQDQFRRVKDRLETDLKNTDHQRVDVQASYFMKYLRSERRWLYSEQLEELQQVTLDEFQLFHRQVFSRVHIEGLVHGNMSDSQALLSGEIVERNLASKSLLPSQQVHGRSVIMPEKFKAILVHEVPDPVETNSAVNYYIQFQNQSSGDVTKRETDRVLAQIVSHIAKEPCFSQLRTIEQLGYSVHCSFLADGSNIGISIQVQSTRDPMYVENRIEEFLRVRIANLLETMSEEGFQKYTRSLIQNKLEKDKNLSQETLRHWKQILSGRYDFTQAADEAEKIEKVSLNDVKRFFAESVLPDSPMSKTMSIHMRSQKLVDEKVQLTEGKAMIADLGSYKAGLGLSNVPSPVKELSHFVI